MGKKFVATLKLNNSIRVRLPWRSARYGIFGELKSDENFIKFVYLTLDDKVGGKVEESFNRLYTLKFIFRLFLEEICKFLYDFFDNIVCSKIFLRIVFESPETDRFLRFPQDELCTSWAVVHGPGCGLSYSVDVIVASSTYYLVVTWINRFLFLFLFYMYLYVFVVLSITKIVS
jgi:hypothetical protein